MVVHGWQDLIGLVTCVLDSEGVFWKILQFRCGSCMPLPQSLQSSMMFDVRQTSLGKLSSAGCNHNDNVTTNS